MNEEVYNILAQMFHFIQKKGDRTAGKQVFCGVGQNLQLKAKIRLAKNTPKTYILMILKKVYINHFLG